MADNSPCLISDVLDVLIDILGLDVGVFGDQLTEFWLEFRRLVDIPRYGRVEQGLHGIERASDAFWLCRYLSSCGPGKESLLR